MRDLREREERGRKIGTLRERDEVERRRIRIGSRADVELGDHVAPYLVVPARLEEGDHLRRTVGRPHLEARLPELAGARRCLAPLRLIELVEPHLGVRQLLEPGDRRHLHASILTCLTWLTIGQALLLA